MNGLTRIIFRGRLVAVVIADQAILTEPLPERDERTVMAMCLYALEIDAGLRAGPYSEERALEYATRAAREATR